MNRLFTILALVAMGAFAPTLGCAAVTGDDDAVTGDPQELGITAPTESNADPASGTNQATQTQKLETRPPAPGETSSGPFPEPWTSRSGPFPEPWTASGRH